MPNLRELQRDWREEASHRHYDRGRGILEAHADALSPHIEREERQSAYIKQLEAVAAQSRSALIMLRECERDTAGSANSETFKAEADELEAALSRLSADKGA